MNEYALLFLAGFAGSMHCAGMCGGFVCALGGHAHGGAANIIRHLNYNLGRIVTYCFIGAITGQLGLQLLGHDGAGSWASYVQRLLAVLSGLLMVIVGLQFFGWLKSSRHQPGGMGLALARGMRELASTADKRAPLALGVLNGFLPCPLIYAFVTQAAVSGGAQAGFLVMLAFGLGTLPAMLVMGAIGWRLHRSRRAGWRIPAVQLAGLFIVLLGLITLARGVLPMGPHLHAT